MTENEMQLVELLMKNIAAREEENAKKVAETGERPSILEGMGVTRERAIKLSVAASEYWNDAVDNQNHISIYKVLLYIDKEIGFTSIGEVVLMIAEISSNFINDIQSRNLN